jgi:hypothetical protein
MNLFPRRTKIPPRKKIAKSLSLQLLEFCAAAKFLVHTFQFISIKNWVKKQTSIIAEPGQRSRPHSSIFNCEKLAPAIETFCRVGETEIKVFYACRTVTNHGFQGFQGYVD